MLLFQTWRGACVPPKHVIFSQTVSVDLLKDFTPPTELTMLAIPPGICYSHDTWEQHIRSQWTFSAQFCSNILYFTCLFVGTAVIPVSADDVSLSHHNTENVMLERELNFPPPLYKFMKTTLCPWLDYRSMTIYSWKQKLHFTFSAPVPPRAMPWWELRERGSCTTPLSHLLALPVFPIVQKQCMTNSDEQSVSIRSNFSNLFFIQSWSCFCDPVTHLQSHGSCLQCQEQELFPSTAFLEYKRENNLKSNREIQRAFASSVLRTVNKPRFEGSHPFNLRWMFAITITGFHYYLTCSKYIYLLKKIFLRLLQCKVFWWNGKKRTQNYLKSNITMWHSWDTYLFLSLFWCCKTCSSLFKTAVFVCG